MPPEPASPQQRSRFSRVLTAVPLLTVGLVGAALALVLPLTAGTWWQVAVYPQLIDERAVKFTTDAVSYLPIAGGEWVLQPWLVTLLLGASWDNGGIAALSFIAAALSGGVLIVLYLLAREGGVARAGAAWVVLAMLPLLWAPTLQSQLFAVLLASLLMLALARGNWWWAPVIIAMWANVHGSTPIAVGMVWGAALGLLYPASRSIPHHLRHWQARFGWAIVSSAMLLATPLFVGVLDYMKRVREIPFIDELTPVWSSIEPLSVQAVVLAAGLVVAVLAAWKGAIRWRELLPLIALAFIAADSRRNTVWVAIVLVPVLARACDVWWSSRPASSTFRSVLPRITHPLLGAIAIVALATTIAFAPGTERRVDAADRGMPVEILDADLGVAKDEARVFIDPAWADWYFVRVGGQVAFDARFERFLADDLDTFVTLAPESGRKAIGELVCRDTDDWYRYVIVAGRDVPPALAFSQTALSDGTDPEFAVVAASCPGTPAQATARYELP